MVIELDPRYMKFDGDLLLTTACPVECDFCVYSCTASKQPEKWMHEETIRRVAEEYSKNDIGIRISGGEPFYDLNKLERCINILLEYYKPYQLLIITSGFWAINENKTRKNLELIKNKGFDRVIISTDRFHAKKIPLKNVENFVKVGKELDLDPVIRITLSGMPKKMMDELIRIIVKYKPKIELHEMGLVGRAEKLPESFGLNNRKATEEDFERRKQLFISKLQKIAKEKNMPINIGFYNTYAAKRHQIDEALEFFPTTFPNGNNYACSMTMKGCYIGNINEESLAFMMSKLKKTISGTIMFRESKCNNLWRYLSPIDRDKCDFCKDQPFVENGSFNSEYLGRKFISLTTKNMSSISKKYDGKHELLLSFQLRKNDLNQNFGMEILKLFNELKKKRIRFKVSRPLPRCLFGQNWSKIIEDLHIPKNCFECHELFTVDSEGMVNFCNTIGQIGPKFKYTKNRKQIFEYFKTFYDNLDLFENCKNCTFLIRKQCSGLCYRYK